MMPGAIGLELRRPADHLPVAAVVDRKQRPGPVLQEPTGDPERRRARARPKLQHPAGLVPLDQRVEKEAEILGAVARPDVLRVAIEIRADERRVGKECVSECRSRWWEMLSKTNHT